MRDLEHPSTSAKALKINLNEKIYGAFAEIGAGQEVARFFFLAGKASQTVAKTMSAYDMVYSDEIYGKEAGGRYVSESRLRKMMEKEFSLIERRLKSTRGERTQFFAYANTVATGDITRRTPHGWMGVRFQTAPLSEPNEFYLHVRMLDPYRLQQQEALGVLGVNLIHAAFYTRANATDLLAALVDHLKKGQIAIDLIVTSGPGFSHVNNDELHLQMLRQGLAECVLVNCAAENSLVQDVVYGKNVLFTVEGAPAPAGLNADVTLLAQKVTDTSEMTCPVAQKNGSVFPLIHRFDDVLGLKIHFRKMHTKSLTFATDANAFEKLCGTDGLVHLGQFFDGQTTLCLPGAAAAAEKIAKDHPELSSALQHFQQRGYLRES